MILSELYKEKKLEVEQGDILVMKNNVEDYFYYLVVKDNARELYTLVNLSSNNIMVSITVKEVSDMINQLKSKLSRLEFLTVIKSENIKLTLN